MCFSDSVSFSVRNILLRFLWIWGVLNGPPTHPIPGVNVKVPFQGKQIWISFCFFDFYEKIGKQNEKWH